MKEVLVREAVNMVLEDGKIASIESTVPNSVEETFDAQGGVVLPGFVDAHTHLPFAGHRANELAWRAEGLSYQEIASRGGGIASTVRQTRAASEEELRETTLRHLSWCLRAGTTTLEAKSGYGLDRETELRQLFAISHADAMLREASGANVDRVLPTFLGHHACPPEYKGRADAYFAAVLEDVLPFVWRAGLAKWVDAFVEEDYCGAEHVRALARKARELDLGLRLHADQLADSGGAALAAELGAKTADHLEHTGPDGIAALAEAGVVPVLLPASVFGLGMDRYPDARSMVEAGLPIVLATDFNPGSSPTPSLPFTMALSVRSMGLSPEECLTAVTVNAAHSLGLEDRAALAPGQLADFSVWPFEDWREVCAWIDGPRPSSVWVAGKRLIG